MNIKRVAGALICGLIVGSSHPVAASYSSVFFFGDGLSDTGNVYASSGGVFPVSPPYFNGVFSNGPLWTTRLSATLNLASNPSLLGGTNFAWAGATLNDYGRPQPEIPQQLSMYFAATGGIADPNALYVIQGGALDVFEALQQPATAPAGIVSAAVALDAMIDGLYTAGARHILVGNLFDIGKTPLALGDGPATAAAASALTDLFNSSLGSLLDADAATDAGLVLERVDFFALFNLMIGDPSEYGFTNVTAPCKSGAVGFDGSVCGTPGSYLFWDSLHPTSRAHQFMADAATAGFDVGEPSPIGLLLAGLVFLAATRRGSLRIQSWGRNERNRT